MSLRGSFQERVRSQRFHRSITAASSATAYGFSTIRLYLSFYSFFRADAEIRNRPRYSSLNRPSGRVSLNRRGVLLACAALGSGVLVRALVARAEHVYRVGVLWIKGDADTSP